MHSYAYLNCVRICFYMFICVLYVFICMYILTYFVLIVNMCIYVLCMYHVSLACAGMWDIYACYVTNKTFYIYQNLKCTVYRDVQTCYLWQQ